MARAPEMSVPASLTGLTMTNYNLALSTCQILTNGSGPLENKILDTNGFH